ncbi:ATP-dependent DNA helicase Hmi1p, mitochondrial [Monosporozyma servazzii]
MIELTTQQQEISQSQWEPNTTVNVVAGPKCGKTVSLVNKVIHHLNTDEIQPNEILILSLTNRSIDSIVNLLKKHDNWKGIPTDQIHISTIHGLANEIVSNKHAQLINIIEEHEWQHLRQLLPINNDTVTRSKKNTASKTHTLENMVKLWKNGLNTSFGFRHLNPLEEDMVQETMKIMKYCNVMTNDDLIVEAINRLKETKSTKLSNYKLIVIDDAQDIYPNLLPFIKQLISMNNAQLCLFHDPNERIYQFMGGNEQVIDELMQLNKKTWEYALVKNFGNTPEIMESANKVLSANFERALLDLTTAKPNSNVDTQLYHTNDSLKQLDFIVNEICKIMTTGVVEFDDIAILSRTNVFMSQIVGHLNSYGIPCEKLVTRPEWINDLRIQFILNIFKIIVLGNTPDVKMCNFAVLILLNQMKGIGQKSLYSLYDFCTKENIPIWQYFLTTPVSKWHSSIANKPKIFNILSIINDNIPKNVDDLKVDDIIQTVNDIIIKLDCPLFNFESDRSMEEFKSNFTSMVKVIDLCESTRGSTEPLLSHFLKTYSVHDPWKESTNKKTIKVATIHSAKSLEFPIVMLANAPPINAQSDFPMDTNTLYTGITRARNLLYMININHMMVQSDNFKRDSNIAMNEPFWKYYIDDKKNCSKLAHETLPQFKYSLARLQQNQIQIQKKFGIRFLSTLPRQYKAVYRALY